MEKTHYKWPFSIAMLVFPSPQQVALCQATAHCSCRCCPLRATGARRGDTERSENAGAR